MPTLSDLYLQDVSGGAVYVPEYPISCKELYHDSRLRFNKNKWKNDYPVTSISFEYFGIYGAHQALSVLGSGIRAHVAVKPSPHLEQHWMRMLRQKDQYASFGTEVQHITTFPVEELRSDLHAVDPDVLFKVHSKAFIGQTACPQAEILETLEFPSMLKVCRAGGGKGTFPIASIEEYNKKMHFISRYMPHADTIVTKFIQNVTKEYNCEFYLNKRGDMQWLGVVEFIRQGKVFSALDQPKLEEELRPSIAPVAKQLQREGYFGIVGCDLLVDSQDKHYVIDINPRLNSSTVLCFLSGRMKEKGYLVGILVSEPVHVKGSTKDAIEICENVEGGEIFVRSAVEERAFTKCCITLCARNQANCRRMLEQIDEKFTRNTF